MIRGSTTASEPNMNKPARPAPNTVLAPHLPYPSSATGARIPSNWRVSAATALPPIPAPLRVLRPDISGPKGPTGPLGPRTAPRPAPGASAPITGPSASISIVELISAYGIYGIVVTGACAVVSALYIGTSGVSMVSDLKHIATSVQSLHARLDTYDAVAFHPGLVQTDLETGPDGSSVLVNGHPVQILSGTAAAVQTLAYRNPARLFAMFVQDVESRADCRRLLEISFPGLKAVQLGGFADIERFLPPDSGAAIATWSDLLVDRRTAPLRKRTPEDIELACLAAESRPGATVGYVVR